MKEKFGQRLRRFREERGLTQTRLAELADLTHSTISKIETSERPAPGIDTVCALAKALRISIDTLVGDAYTPK